MVTAVVPHAGSVHQLPRARVVDLVAARLLELGSALADDTEVWERFGRQAAAVVEDCVASMDAGCVVVDQRGVTAAAGLAPLLIDRGIPVLEAVRAGAVLCDVVAEVLTEPPAAPTARAWLGLRAAQRSAALRVEACATSCTALSTARDEQYRRADRRLLARELHDYVGTNISLAQRHLELHRLYRDRGHPSAPRELQAAEQVLQDVLGGTRRLLHDLRAQTPLSGLGLALNSFLTSTAPDAAVELDVNGDELLLSDHERDELYLICQEGLRNAFAHARATHVAVRVEIGTDRTEAVIEDDGGGFDPGRDSVPGHQGLTSMRERAQLLGGTFELSSSPGGGTRARVRVPAHGKGRS
jgi:signal transduction histidine kinase